ncbi:MAG: 5'/3'-nucleotidase SurE [Desulfobacterales bacterium]|nr:5'/3'-nucleotidase SurE [Desulfobacterales bacterium]
MNVLLTNDDGIYANGLWELYKCFYGKHKVTVIAPDRERSAVSHGITIRDPLRANLIEVCDGYVGYAVNGTPADCVKLGILEILKSKPDIVISGINPGANVEINIHYSGTVAAAKEAALFGIPSIAVSIEEYNAMHYEDAACFVKSLTDLVFEKGMPFGTFLNVNIPDKPKNKISGIIISRQGTKRQTMRFDKRIDPRSTNYYWLGYDNYTFEGNIEVDGDALMSNYISITPLKCDMTDYAMLQTLTQWEINSIVGN